ncbi:MAG: deoxyribonuclease IV, partial [Gemmatimonadales bacterium]
MTTSPAERLGAHVSAQGGLPTTPQRGIDIGATAIQVFTKTPSQWKEPVLGDDVVAAYRAALEQSGLRAVVSHDSYLINLASPDPARRQQSLEAFAEELRRCDQLGIPYLVTHPGSHMGEGEDVGLARVAEALRRALADTMPATTMVLLETTAGQGSYLGHRFAHLGRLLELVPEEEFNARLGVCL